MRQVSASDPFSQHYLEIQALNPVDAKIENPASSPPTFALTLPILAILVLFLGVFAWQFYSRLKDLHRVLMVVLLVAVAGSIPLVANLVNHRSFQSGTKAVSDQTPQSIVIKDVTNTSFSVSWKTKSPTQGAVRLATSVNMQKNLMVIHEAKPGLTHTVLLTSLKPKTLYYLEIFSDSLWYNYQRQPLIVETLP